MRHIEELMVETGRVINRRYLLQRLVKQGQACVVYQGFDQVLQRAVAVKVAPVEQASTYRAAIRVTSQFSHPNIVGIYDLIIEPDVLYIVQEYVDGNDFAALLNTPLSLYEVVDLGRQICQALMYASTSSRKVCHGDLTPAAILRDRRGLVRVNGFALPGNVEYFTSWSMVGGDGIVFSDEELPPGQLSEGRLADDTRAVGLLLYQLLAGRSPGTTSVEPPPDGRLRFQRNVPPELCELVARTVVRQHPQHITTPDALYIELKKLAEVLEPPPEMVPAAGPYQMRNAINPGQYAPSTTGQLSGSLPTREAEAAGFGVAAYQQVGVDVHKGQTPPGSVAPTLQAVAEMPARSSPLQQSAFQDHSSDVQSKRVNFPVLLAVGLVLFILFFVIGYFLAHAVFPF